MGELDDVREFLRWWYGPGLDSPAGALTADAAVPPDLAQWHSVAARAGVPVTFQDRPIALTRLSPEPGGMLPFWAENQNGHHWAVDSRNRVFARESGSEDWLPTGEDLRGFLLHCTIREAIIGAPEKFTVFVPESVLGDALESFEPLGFPALASEEPETRLWAGAGALARVTLPPVGYEHPSEQLWMITVAVPRGADIQGYEARFGVPSSGGVTGPAAGRPPEEPPF
ncbi:hypothetical protein [Actinoplanes sichuanensis]|uniref:Uncharacterized protein n=1 Tax=Actinoplanes sichuanensis TaxID=512349 RepID=A0ABW4A440_9ACTN